MNQDFVKLDTFDGTNFFRWKDKIMFFLIAFKIPYSIDPSLFIIPILKNDYFNTLKARCIKCEENKILCRRHIYERSL